MVDCSVSGCVCVVQMGEEWLLFLTGIAAPLSPSSLRLSQKKRDPFRWFMVWQQTRQTAICVIVWCEFTRLGSRNECLPLWVFWRNLPPLSLLTLNQALSLHGSCWFLMLRCINSCQVDMALDEMYLWKQNCSVWHQDVTQEMESKYLAAYQCQVKPWNQLLLSLPPFHLWHPKAGYSEAEHAPSN